MTQFLKEKKSELDNGPKCPFFPLSPIGLFQCHP